MINQEQADIKALQASILKSKVDRCRSMSIGIKLLEGARLFDVARQRMLDGIRVQYPDWNMEQVQCEFHRRLDVQRQREERGIYTCAGTIPEYPVAGE